MSFLVWRVSDKKEIYSAPIDSADSSVPPRWSPDGTMVAFSGVNPEFEKTIYFLNTVSWEKKSLTINPFDYNVFGEQPRSVSFRDFYFSSDQKTLTLIVDVYARLNEEVSQLIIIITDPFFVLE